MGTSGMFGGSKSGLVPSWADEEAPSPVGLPDGAEGGGEDGGIEEDGGETPAPTAPAQYPPVPALPPKSGLRAARSSLTRGARTSDAGAIRRGAGKYVGASGGGRSAARRMPSSRSVSGRVARLASSFANQGPSEVLRRFDLEGMAGAPAEDVFLALTEMLCPAGSTIDEAIARDAMLETVADLAAAGVGSFDELSADDLQEFFIGVVSRSIGGKILNEVGTNTVSVPAGVAGVERAQNMLFDFVEGCVRDEFDVLGQDLGDLESSAIDSFVEDLYAAALDLVAALGEER